jgi:DNA-directed RNA polymerase beta subunit
MENFKYLLYENTYYNELNNICSYIQSKCPILGKITYKKNTDDYKRYLCTDKTYTLKLYSENYNDYILELLQPINDVFIINGIEKVIISQEINYTAFFWESSLQSI